MAEEIVKTENVFGTDERLSAQEIQQLRALMQTFPIHNHDGRNSLEVATKKVKSSIIAERVSSPADIVAGETLSNGEAVRISSPSFNIITNDLTPVASSGSTISAGQYLAQAFSLNNFESGGTTGNLVIYIKGTTNHIATVRASIYNDTSGSPGSTEHVFEERTTDLDGSNYQSFTFDVSGYAPTAGTTYWLVVKYVSGGSSISLGRYSDGYYTNKKNTGSWGADSDTNDWWFQLGFAESSSNKVFKATSFSSDMDNLFVGIADSNATSGQSIEYISFGTKLDFTNLTSGSIYYLTTTAGSIGTIGLVGKHVVPVGKALSTEILSIQLPALS